MCVFEQLTGTCVVGFVSVVKKRVRLSTSENDENRSSLDVLLVVVKVSGFVIWRLCVRVSWYIRTVVT